MAAYKLLLKATAAIEIEAVGAKVDRQRIVKRIQSLAVEPRTTGSEKLAGYDDRYRVRQGQYRIVYLIDDERHEVTIFKIGHRKEIYR